MKISDIAPSIDPWKNAYWTCFFNAGRDVSKFHVTHKYFGQLPKVEVDDVLYIIDSFFEVKRDIAKSMIINFNIEKRFDDVPGSGDGLVKVFCTDDEQIEARFSSLRDAFWPYAKDTYPTYTPHLTGAEPNTIALNRYALCLDDEILKVWELSE